MESILPGSTSVILSIFIQDSSKGDGSGLSGLVYNASGLVAYYARSDQGNAGASAITLADATRGTFTSSGFKEKDSANMPGWYEFGIPNAAIAAGSKWVALTFKGAALMAPVNLKILLGNPVSQMLDGVIAAATFAAGALDDDALIAAIADQVHDELRSGHTVVGSFGEGAASVQGNVTGSIGSLATQAKSDVNAEADTALSDYGALQPTTAGRKLDVTTGGEAGIDWANVGSPTSTVGLSGTTVKTATDVETDTQDIQGRLPAALSGGKMDSHVNDIAASAITASSIATDAITAAKIAADAIGASELAADAVTEIQSGLSTLTQANVRTAIGLGSANLDTQLAAVQTDVDDLQARTPAALTVGGNMKSDALAINGSTAAAAGIARTGADIVSGLAVSGTLSTTQMTTDLASTKTGNYIGRPIYIRTGTSAGQMSVITAYDGSTKKLSFSPALTDAPSNGDAFDIT